MNYDYNYYFNIIKKEKFNDIEFFPQNYFFQASRLDSVSIFFMFLSMTLLIRFLFYCLTMRFEWLRRRAWNGTLDEVLVHWLLVVPSRAFFVMSYDLHVFYLLKGAFVVCLCLWCWIEWNCIELNSHILFLSQNSSPWSQVCLKVEPIWKQAKYASNYCTHIYRWYTRGKAKEKQSW